MKRAILAFLLLAVLILFTACAAPPRLVVANWKDYGSDLPWAVEAFEKKTGVKVVHQYFNSEEELLAMVREGGIGKIDVILPNLAYVQPALRDDLLQPLDLQSLSHIKEIYPELLDLPDLQKDGRPYCVPWMWGSTSLAYNTEKVSGPVDSWSLLWDPQMRGKVGFFDDAPTAIMTAALYLGEDPYDPPLDRVKEALLDLKKNVKLYWSSADDWLKAFHTGAITAGNLWSGLAGTQMAQGDPIAFVIPKEGSVGWLDCWAIVKGTAHEDLAYQWIDYMISTDFQVRWAKDPERSSPAPANRTAHEMLPQEVARRIQSDPEALGHLFMQRDIPPETLQRWIELWQEVKASP
ncbi:MAG: extracellular solute-binding protein [Clostridiales bacterium]|nr:extracellular solute-binding protein [Clostridiales bacterium]